MKSTYLLALLGAVLASAQTYAMVLHINSLECQQMSVAFNATKKEIAVMPPYASVTVDNQTQQVRMPASPSMPNVTSDSSQMTMSYTFIFASPFIVDDGFHNTTISLTDSINSTTPLASFHMLAVQFMGCSNRSEAAMAAPVGQSAAATASLDAAYVATATSAQEEATSTSTPYSLPYYTASGLPYNSPFYDSPSDATPSSTGHGLGVGAKIGIAIGVLGAALLAVVCTIAVFAWRHRRAGVYSTEEDGQGSEAPGRMKARRHVSNKWVHDTQELKEISSPEMR